MANGTQFDPVAEARKKWPGLADWSDDDLRSRLSDPGHFRQAFPEYGELDDETIRFNISRTPAPTRTQAAVETWAPPKPLERIPPEFQPGFAERMEARRVQPQPLRPLAELRETFRAQREPVPEPEVPVGVPPRARIEPPVQRPLLGRVEQFLRQSAPGALLGLTPETEQESLVRRAEIATERPLLPFHELAGEPPPLTEAEREQLGQERVLAGRGLHRMTEELAGFTTPQTVGIIAMAGGTSTAGKAVAKLVAAGFSLDLLKHAAEKSGEFVERIRVGDAEGAVEAAASAAVPGFIGVKLGRAALRGKAAPAKREEVRAEEPRRAARPSEPLVRPPTRPPQPRVRPVHEERLPEPQPVSPKEAADLGVPPEMVPVVNRLAREAASAERRPVVPPAAPQPEPRPRRVEPIVRPPVEEARPARAEPGVRPPGEARPAELKVEPPRLEIRPARIEEVKAEPKVKPPAEAKRISNADLDRWEPMISEFEVVEKHGPQGLPGFADSFLVRRGLADLKGLTEKGREAVRLLRERKEAERLRPVREREEARLAERQEKLKQTLEIELPFEQRRALDAEAAAGKLPQARYPGEYIRRVLEPIREAYLKAAGGEERYLQEVKRGKYAAVPTPEEFKGKQFFRIRIPGEGGKGELLVRNTHEAIERAYTKGPEAYRYTPPKPVEVGRGLTAKGEPRVIPRGKPEQLVKSIEREIESLERGQWPEGKAVEGPSGEMRREMLEAARENLQEAKRLARGEPKVEKQGPKGAYGYPIGRREPVMPVQHSYQARTNPELVARSDVVRLLQEAFNRPFRVGKFRQKALGIYKPLEETIRLRVANDLPVAAHEAGHHINKLIWGTYSRKRQAVDLNWKPLTPFRQELNPRNGFGYYPEGRSYLPESFADFVMEYITKPTEAQRRAPKFSDFFEKELDKPANQPVREVLLEARRLYELYNQQGPEAKIFSQISKRDVPPPVGERISGIWNRLRIWTEDALLPLRWSVEAMEKAKGERLPAEENAYTLARLNAGWWSRADEFLTHSPFNAKTLKPEGKPLREILRPIEENIDDFRTYLVALRTLDLAPRGIKTGVKVQDAQSARQSLEAKHKDFRAAAEELHEFQDSTLRYIRDSGLLSEAQYQTIRQLNQFYVPLFRVFEESVAGGRAGGGERLGDLWTPVKRIKGSERDIIDPLESIVKNTYTMINLADRNRAMLAFTRQARRTEGSGEFIEKIPEPMRATKFQLDEIRRSLREAGIDAEALSKADLETVAMVFRPSHLSSPKEGVLTVMERGKREFYQVHNPDLYKALQGLDKESGNLLITVLSKPASLLRLGATGLGPEFVIRNPLRDTMEAMMQTRVGFRPGIDTIRGLASFLGRDEYYREWRRAGGEHAAMVSIDRTTLQSNLGDLMKSKPAWVVRHPVEAARMLSEAMEAATRIGIYRRGREAALGQLEATLEAREGTLDFQRIGAKTRAVNMIIAFWNATIQGMSKYARTHRENPKGAAIKGILGITAPTLLLWWLNKDDPRYQALAKWEKDFFWNIPTDGTPLANTTPFIKIPKPFLWGLTYGTMVERFAEWVNKRDAKAWDGFAGAMWETQFPGVLPTGISPYLEALTNYDLFRDRPIEPRGLERLPPAERATPYTSEFSKSMVRALDRNSINVPGLDSPAKLDHVIYGHTGSLGRAVVKTADPLFRETGREPPARSAADIPFIRAFMTRWPTMQAEPVNRFWERLQELEQKHQAYRTTRKYPGGDVRGGPLTREEGSELSRLRKYQRRFQKVRERIRRIQADQSLSGQQKRQQIDYWTLRQIRWAQEALGAGPFVEVPEEPLVAPP